MAQAVIVSTARTPIGRAYRGAFNNTHGATLGGHVVAEAVRRAKVEPGEVEDVLIGCARPEGAAGGNVARQCAIRAGLPVTVPGTTINRFCSSGLQTIAMAAQRIRSDDVQVLVAGGLEVDLALPKRPFQRPSRAGRVDRRAQAGTLLADDQDRRYCG